MSYEQQIVGFVENVYKCRHLREEFRRLYEALEQIAGDLSLDGKLTLYAHMRLYLIELAIELEEAEHQVEMQLSQVLEIRSVLAKSDGRFEEGGHRETWTPGSAPPPASAADDVRALESWDVPPSDVLPPDRPITTASKSNSAVPTVNDGVLSLLGGTTKEQRSSTKGPIASPGISQGTKKKRDDLDSWDAEPSTGDVV